MKTAQEVILSIDELSPEEQQAVFVYIENLQSEKPFQETNYSPEEMAKIDKDLEEAEKGINVCGPFHTTEEIFAHLDNLQPE
jgi:hypothetical protein